MNTASKHFFQSDIIGLIPELFLIICLLIVLLYGSFEVKKACMLYTYILPNVARLTLVSFSLCLFLIYNNPIIFQVLWSGTFLMDYLGNHLKFFSTFILCLCILLSETFFYFSRIRNYEIFIFFIGICLSLCLLISSFDFLSIYLSVEFLSLIFYTIASLKKKSGFSAEASLKYFILGSLASAFFLFGASLVYFITGSTNLGHIGMLIEDLGILLKNIDFIIRFDSVNAVNFYSVYIKAKEFVYFYRLTPSVLLYFGFGLLASSLLFKLGSAPFHLWVPDVYEGAPTLITLIFAAVPKFSIFVVLCRLAFTSSMYFFLYLWKPLFFICGALSLIIGCLGGLGEMKIKRVLAYSGIGHIGFLCFSFSCSSKEGLQGMFFYLYIYMITAVFIWSYVLFLNPIKKKWLSLLDSVGVAQTNPGLGLITFLMVFSLAGIPPFGGFFSKNFVFIALIDALFFPCALLAILSSGLSSFYYLRLIKILYFEKNQNWFFFCALSKSHSLVLSASALYILFYIFSPVTLFLLTFKLATVLLA